MEIKAILKKPYTDNERMDFIVEYNHNQGYVIEETETELQALGYTEEELKLQENRNMNNRRFLKWKKRCLEYTFPVIRLMLSAN